MKPHLVHAFKLSNDPRFEDKLIDVVGLYVNPPEQAIVLCLDEKSSVQALDWTQPSLLMVKGRAETMTHDYKRHGTTTLVAALDVLTGRVIGECLPRHPQACRRAGLAGQTSPVNRTLVSRVDRQALRRGVFHSVPDLITKSRTTSPPRPRLRRRRSGATGSRWPCRDVHGLLLPDCRQARPVVQLGLQLIEVLRARVGAGLGLDDLFASRDEADDCLCGTGHGRHRGGGHRLQGVVLTGVFPLQCAGELGHRRAGVGRHGVEVFELWGVLAVRCTWRAVVVSPMQRPPHSPRRVNLRCLQAAGNTRTPTPGGEALGAQMARRH